MVGHAASDVQCDSKGACSLLGMTPGPSLIFVSAVTRP